MNLQRMMYQYKATAGKYLSYVKRAGDRLWKVLTFGLVEGVIVPRKCLCVSLEKGSVSITYGSLFLSRIRLRGSRRYYFDKGRYAQPENLVLAISMAVDGLKAHGAEIVLVVPKEWVLVRAAELPAVVRENLSSVVGYELDRLTPFGPAEALYDFKVYGEEEGKLKVSIAAMRADVLKPYLDALKEREMVLSRITASVTSLGTLGSAFVGNGTLVALSVNDIGYEGCLAKRGVVYAGFHGWFISDDKERNLETVIDDVAARVQDLLAGGAAPSVVVCAAEDYSIIEEEVGAPVKVLKEGDVKAMFGSTTQEIICAPLGSLLEAFRVRPGGFDLASKGSVKTRRAPLLVTGALVCLIVAMMVPYLVVPLEMEKRRLEDIRFEVVKRKGEVKKVEALKAEIETMSKEVSQIRTFKESTPMSIAVMKELTTILPKTVWLTRSRITNETVEIEGYATQSATELLQKLEQSPLLKKVEFSSPTVRDARTNSDRFLIKMEIEGFEKKSVEGVKDEKKK